MSVEKPPQPISTATAEHYTWGPNCDAWFFLKRDDIHIIQERMPPGAAEVMHYHRKSRQLFYVLSGELTMKLESATIQLPASQAISIEPNTPHLALNDSHTPVEFLVISCPPSHTDRINID